MNIHHPPDKPDTFEDLFQQAEPRLKPPAADTREIRDALHQEWSHLTRRRKLRKYAVSTGLAAAVLMAGLIGMNLFNNTQPVSNLAPLASVDRQTGTITIRDGKPGTPATTAGQPGRLYPGQTLNTGTDSRVAIRWHSGASVRLDEDTRLRLVSRQEIELLAGRLYIDTRRSSQSQTGSPELSILTAAGRVRHLGTQYMTEVIGQHLVVSVREGQVGIQANSNETIASTGQQLTVSDNGLVSRAVIDSFGDEWHWTEIIAPGFELDGVSMAEFLKWVGRETGRPVYYTSQSAQQLADESLLRGSIDLEPRLALTAMLQTSDLEARTEGNSIIISLSDSQ